MNQKGVDKSKRQFLTSALSVVGAVGTGYLAVPFLSQMRPSAKAMAAGAPVEVDISKMETGQLIRVAWRGKPVWILNRTPEVLGDIIHVGQQAGRSAIHGFHPTRNQSKCRSFHKAGNFRGRGSMHPSWLFAYIPTGNRAKRFGRGLERRFFLPLPRFLVRSGRPGLSWCSRARQISKFRRIVTLRIPLSSSAKTARLKRHETKIRQFFGLVFGEISTFQSLERTHGALLCAKEL